MNQCPDEGDEDNVRERKRIDDDWKKRAAEEKAKLAGNPAGEAGADAGAGAGGAPAAGASGTHETDQVFVRLVSTLGGQAMMALGMAEDPHTGQRYFDLDMARQTVDMLGALEKKSRGNLSSEEDALLGDVLHQLRLAYAQAVQQAQAAAQDPGPGGGAAPAGPGS